jgi:hypothetical protein
MLAAHAERIDRDGYTILEGVIEPELRDALNDDLVRLERFYGVMPSDNGFEGTKTVRIYNLLALGKLYEKNGDKATGTLTSSPFRVLQMRILVS